jgi:hypothetical protein
MDTRANPEPTTDAKGNPSTFGPGKGAILGAIVGAAVVLWQLLAHPIAKMEPALDSDYVVYLLANVLGWAVIGAAIGAVLGGIARLVVAKSNRH